MTGATANTYGYFIARHRWLVIFVSIIVFFVTAAGAPRIVLDDNYKIFFSEDNPHLLALNELEDVYAKEETVLYVLAPKDGKVFTADTLRAIQELSEASWQITYGTRVDSITSFQHTYAEGDDIVIEDLVPQDAELTDEYVTKIRDFAVNEPRLVNRLISPDGDVTAVAATIILPGLGPGERAQPIADARAIADEFRANHPDIDVYMVGGAVLSLMFTEYTQKDMGTLTPLMYVIIFIALGLILRSLWSTLTSVFVIMVAVGSAMGLSGWFDLHLTATSSAMPTVVMTLAVADCVHILSTFLAKCRAGAARADAMEYSIRINLRPVTITSFTTALGLLTTQFSDVPPLQDYGVMTAMGVGMAWLFAVTLLPALMCVLPAPKIRAAHESAFFERLGMGIANRQREILVVSAIVILVTGFGLSQIDFKNNWVTWFKDHTPFRQDLTFVSSHLSGASALEYSVPANGPGGISDPEYLHALDDFAKWMREQPYVDHVSTLSDTMRQLNMSMHGDDPEYYKIPDSSELAAQYLLLYEMSLPYGHDLNNTINVDKSATRLLVIMQDKDSSIVNGLKKSSEAWFEENAPAYMRTQATGNGVMFASIAESTIRGIAISTPIALIAVTVLLVVLFRSLRYGLICLVPNLAPIIVAFGLWGYFYGHINFGVACVSGLAIGIVVDDTVHFMSKYLHARHAEGMLPEAAVRYAFTTVGPALVTTSVVLMAGFSVMLVSSFNFNAHMGMLAAMAIGAALLADIFLLPATLLLVDRTKES